MTSLLPPNLLKLFAPRPLPPFLKPLSRDESVRGPNRQRGVATLLQKIKDEAEEAEIKGGLADVPVTNGDAETGTVEVKDEEAKKEVDERIQVDGEEDGEVEEKEKEKVTKGKGKKVAVVKKVRKDKISELGVVGQEAVKMRRELKKQQQEQYKKDSEKNCELSR
jgi:U1 small nuclear ribonucleoprotein